MKRLCCILNSYHHCAACNEKVCFECYFNLGIRQTIAKEDRGIMIAEYAWICDDCHET